MNLVQFGAIWARRRIAFNWTQRTSGFGATEIRRGAYDGSTYLVIVGASGKISYSTDGINWILHGTTIGTAELRGLNYGNGYWVLSGGLNNLYTVTNPAGTWTKNNTVGFSDEIYQVYYNGTNQWVAVGKSGEVATCSADPTGTWTMNAGSTWPVVNVLDVEYDGSTYWVACGNAGNIRYTADPTGAWTLSTNSIGAGNNVNGISYGNGIWVAVAHTGILAYTVDPSTSWTNASSPFGATDHVIGVSFGSGTFVVVTVNGKIAHSTDGINWTLESSPSFGGTDINESTYISGYFIAMGVSAKVATSF